MGFSKRLVLLFFLVLPLTALACAQRAYATEACLDCHQSFTPEIVDQYQQSGHSQYGVGCLDCHQAQEEDPSGFNHVGGRVTSVVSPKACGRCHAEEVEEYQASKHAWTAFIGPLKPWYNAMLDQGLDPLDPETALEHNPEDYIKRLVTPLYPDSGALANAGLLGDPEYNHENQVAGCLACHGSYVVASDGLIKDGWPNTGVGRVNPDGSLGSCSSCHTRHVFSVEEARKPETCGQCHLGPDHPQMEIYEESKHGNIYHSSGEEWDWGDEEWGVDDINAPTCATCHMSGFQGVVETTHDAGARLYWELQPKVSVPQWDSAELTARGLQSPDPEQAQAGRAEMKRLCGVCHADSWVDGHFESLDRTVSDYNKAYEYVWGLLSEAYDEGLIDASNPIDEVPEVMYYFIWHHDGRRWRMGVSMMGPDWTHWNGAVDSLMDKLNTMEDWLRSAREAKAVEAQLAQAEEALEATQEALEEASTQLQEAQLRMAELEAQAGQGTSSLLLISAILAVAVVAAAYVLRQRVSP